MSRISYMFDDKGDINIKDFAGEMAQVFEYSDGLAFDDHEKQYRFAESFWYPIGSPYSTLGEAMNRMLELQTRYGKYGRKYTVKLRYVSEWKEI